MNKLFDLRFVIGSFFLVIGILLLGYSFFEIPSTGDFKNINQWSGVVFIVFGIVMIIFALQKDADDELLEKE